MLLPSNLARTPKPDKLPSASAARELVRKIHAEAVFAARHLPSFSPANRRLYLLLDIVCLPRRVLFDVVACYISRGVCQELQRLWIPQAAQLAVGGTLRVVALEEAPKHPSAPCFQQELEEKEWDTQRTTQLKHEFVHR